MAADWRSFASLPEIKSLAGEVRRVDLWRYLDCCPMPLTEVGEKLTTEITRIDSEPILLAYSMGGRIALHSLLAQPMRWKAVIIISAHSGLKSEDERVARREKDAEWSTLALKGEWSDFLTKWDEQSVLQGDVDLPDRMRLKSRRASIARSFVDWSLGAQEDLSARLSEVSCPILWINGEYDVKFTQLGQQAVSNLQKGKHKIVAGCGHRVPWEKPAEFAGVCRSFIEKHDLS